MDYFDYIAKKVAPKPSHRRPMPPQRKPDPEPEPIVVEESTASDSMIVRALNFWKRRALKEGRTRTIGLIVPATAPRMTFMQLDFVGAVMEAAARADLDVLLSPSGGDHDRFLERIVTGRRVDGVILMEIRMADDRVTRLQRSGLPFVTIGRTSRPNATCWVDIDVALLVRQCVDHLADLGHRDLALVNRPAELSASGYGPARRARSGFAKALTARGITGVELPCGDDAEAGERCVEEIRSGHPEVTAIVTTNEAALPGMQRALDHAGLAVPGQLSITGIVARHWAEQFWPAAHRGRSARGGTGCHRHPASPETHRRSGRRAGAHVVHAAHLHARQHGPGQPDPVKITLRLPGPTATTPSHSPSTRHTLTWHTRVSTL